MKFYFFQSLFTYMKTKPEDTMIQYLAKKGIFLGALPLKNKICYNSRTIYHNHMRFAPNEIQLR